MQLHYRFTPYMVRTISLKVNLCYWMYNWLHRTKLILYPTFIGKENLHWKILSILKSSPIFFDYIVFDRQTYRQAGRRTGGYFELYRTFNTKKSLLYNKRRYIDNYLGLKIFLSHHNIVYVCDCIPIDYSTYFI